MLFILSSEEDITVRELSLKVGITERSVHKILIDLQENGYVSILKNGRNNQYKLNYNKKLRHPVEKHIKIGQLIDLISK